MKNPNSHGTLAAVGCALFLIAAYAGLKILLSSPGARILFGAWADAPWMITGNSIVILAVMSGLMAVCLRLTGQTWADLGLKASLSRREAAWGAVAGLAVYGSITAFHSFEHASARQPEAALSALIFSPSRSWFHALFSISLLTGVLEELVYRGAIVGFLRRGFGGGAVAAGLAAFVSGLVFSVMHPLTGLNAYILYAGIGAGLSLVYMHTGSLGTVILAHVLANGIAVVCGLIAN